jgi:hypothetical protein
VKIGLDGSVRAKPGQVRAAYAGDLSEDAADKDLAVRLDGQR